MEITVESLETPALTKAQLAELLFEQIGLNKRESKDMIDAFFDLVSESLVDGDDVIGDSGTRGADGGGTGEDGRRGQCSDAGQVRGVHGASPRAPRDGAVM